MTKAEVLEYLAASSRIEGWFFPIDVSLFAAVDAQQAHLELTGNCFEIGVHHGKSAVLLARLLRSKEVLGVCDVFEQQHLNADRSGEGSRELFERNLSNFATEAVSRVKIFAKPSERLTVEETTSYCRLFHIDGGHRPENVLADLAVAERALSAEGIVVLDDVFNPSWPGVGEGLYRFLNRHPDTFAPLIIGGNKVFFARPTAIPQYEQSLNQFVTASSVDLPAFTFQRKEWLGRNVLTASRRDWVDLHPVGAARLHVGDQSWRTRLLFRLLGSDD